MIISVIVPVYNVLNYLPRCLDSIVNQTQKDLEIIIVDDGSTDGSSKIVDEYATKDTRIRAFHKENGGLMSAWTLAVRESKGDYIGFVDSDDAVCLDMFERMLKVSIETDADIVMCDSKDSFTGKLFTSSLKSGLYQGEDMKLIQSRIFPYPGNPGVSNARWNKLYKRHLIVDNLKYTGRLSRTFEDRYIVPAAIMTAKSFYYLNEPLYIYTLDRTGCNSKKYKKNLIEDVNRMYEVQQQVLLDKGLWDEYGENWEKLYLDCIRVYLGRNILGIVGFHQRYDSAKDLFKSKYFLNRMKKYGSMMNGKMGIVIRLSYSFRSPALLSLLSYLK